jgi:hypothetical protein
MEEGVMIMKKTNTILMLTAVFVVIFAAACSAPAAPATQAAAPAVEQPAVQQPAVDQPVAAEPAVEAAPPLVAADTAASETYCVNKIPYQNILLDEGVTFESLDTSGELQCKDSGTDVEGKNVITCTGKQLWTYELKLVNSSSSAVIKVNMGACPTS